MNGDPRPKRRPLKTVLMWFADSRKELAVYGVLRCKVPKLPEFPTHEEQPQKKMTPGPEALDSRPSSTPNPQNPHTLVSQATCSMFMAWPGSIKGRVPEPRPYPYSPKMHLRSVEPACKREPCMRLLNRRPIAIVPWSFGPWLPDSAPMEFDPRSSLSPEPSRSSSRRLPPGS